MFAISSFGPYHIKFYCVDKVLGFHLMFTIHSAFTCLQRSYNGQLVQAISLHLNLAQFELIEESEMSIQ